MLEKVEKSQELHLNIYKFKLIETNNIDLNLYKIRLAPLKQQPAVAAATVPLWLQLKCLHRLRRPSFASLSI